MHTQSSAVTPRLALTNETRVVDDRILVQRYNICTTRLWIYEAWERTRESYRLPSRHSTITTFDGRWYGTLPSRALPADLEALPAYTDERLIAVTGWQETNQAAAYAAILRAFPEAAEGIRRGGQVELGANLPHHHGRRMVDDTSPTNSRCRWCRWGEGAEDGAR